MRVRTRLAVFVQVGLALAGSCGMAWGQAFKATPFTKEVEAHFDAWDRNRDGALEAEEIDALVVDADLKGTSAAAVAALKAAQRSGKYELPALTLEYFHKYEADVAGGKKPQPAFDQTFSRGSRRISRSNRDLFADGVPSLESCHQGPLGDCFFVAVVGASIVRDPADVRSMIKQEGDASFTVSFPIGKATHVSALTDAELALTSTTGNDGLWLAVLEKAYGKLRTEGLPEEKQMASTTDAIARGGSTSTTIRLMTGHSVSRVGLRPRTGGKSGSRKTDGDKQDGKSEAPAIDEAALNAHLDATLPGLREQLVEAMANHRLAAAGTPKEGKLPPGINGSHAYAILGYDRGTDVVKLWNPHGNTFRPKGEPGLENGYPTKAGHFEMPLAEMGRVFNGVTIETEKPAPKS
jgi:Calpain family cysteine protease